MSYKSRRDDHTSSSSYSSSKVDPPMSSYWVQFFKNAGFPTDVATKHAIIFSNNRIKPDMLPDLDKPSLKEMGITLMGDMIAILRYAKKVVEEIRCKDFLVDSADEPPKNVEPPKLKSLAKPILKKAPIKPALKTTAVASKVKIATTGKLAPKLGTNSAATKSLVAPKKKVVVKRSPSPSRMYSDYIDTQRPTSQTNNLKRKYEDDEEEDDDNDVDDRWLSRDIDKRMKLNDEDDDVKYNVIMTKGPAVRTQKTIKNNIDKKKTVFHRLGDSLVSSTTNSYESSSPTFNVTGLSSRDSYKKNHSVFNRLGGRDYNQDEQKSRGLKNGSSTNSKQGILKTRTLLSGTKVYARSSPVRLSNKITVGTMRADQEELRKKTVSDSNAQHLSLPSKKFENLAIKTVNKPLTVGNFKVGGLASDRLTSVPAKARLGTGKQVTFNKTPSVSHVKKPSGVFSRLGV